MQYYFDLEDCVKFLYVKVYWPLFEIDLNVKYSQEFILYSFLFISRRIIQIDHTPNKVIKLVSHLWRIVSSKFRI